MSVRSCRLIDRFLKTELLNDLCRTEVEQFVDLFSDNSVIQTLGSSAVGVYENAQRSCYTDGIGYLHEHFLGNTGCYPTLAHNEEIMERHRTALDKVFYTISETLKKGGKEAVVEAIGGPVCQTGFQRLIG